jgi:hypothetical protein
VAEQILASDLQRQTSRIGLRQFVGGFAQPEHAVDGERRRLRVDGLDLVVRHGDVERRHRLTTLAGAAAAAGVQLGFPTDLYAPATADIDGHDDLTLDLASARRIAECFALGQGALAEMQRRYPDDAPTVSQLWSEHFDLACTLDEVNYGVSPGDTDHDEPYLYVGPWTLRPDRYWNEPWGCSVPVDEGLTVAAAVSFFEAGRAVAQS